MTATLEQELESMILGSDYRLGIHASSGYLHVDVIYVPAFRAVDTGGRIPVVTNNGEVGSACIGGPWKWWRARRFVRKTIAGHRKVLEAGVIQVR